MGLGPLELELQIVVSHQVGAANQIQPSVIYTHTHTRAHTHARARVSCILGWLQTFHVSEDNFAFLILLPSTSECWDYKYMPPHPV